MKKILLLLSIFFLFSCKDEVRNVSNSKNITFNIPFEFNLKFSGTYQNLESNEELIYIGEPVTKKKIYFYNINGQVKDSISLNKVLIEVEQIDAVSITNRDSIFLFGSNKILLIDRNGNVNISTDLTKFTTTKTGDVNTLIFSTESNFTDSNKSIIINTDWRYNIFDNNLEKYKIGSFEMLKSYYNDFYDKPNLARLDDFTSDSLTIFYSSKNTYKHLFSSPRIFLEGFSTKEIKNDFFYYSWYSDKILKFNKSTMEFVDQYLIESNFTKIGAKPLQITKKNNNNVGKAVSQKLQSEGNVCDLLYDKFSEKFYVIVLHDFNIKENQSINFRPFSILVYSKEFKKIKEIKFDYGTHRPYNCIQTSQGILVLNKYKNETDPKVFSLFN